MSESKIHGPNYCSKLNAICPKAPTCYGENIEIVDDTCSNGMVLCTDVDNEENRYMYDAVELEQALNNEPDVYCHFERVTGRSVHEAQWPCDEIECSDCMYGMTIPF